MINEQIITELRDKHKSENTSYRQLSKMVEEKTGEKIAPSTLNDWINGGWEKRKGKESLPTNEQFEIDKNLASARADAKIWKNKYQSVVKNSVFQDRIIDEMRTYVQALRPLPVKQLEYKKQHSSEHHAVLLLSDLHLGEVVDFEQTRGIGQFNMEIASKRLDLLAEKVLELVEIERNGLNITDLHIFGLGDMVSGGKAMHDELQQTNEVNILEQTTIGSYMLSHFTAKLSPHFPIIHKRGVVGNHGRDAKKPYFKDRYVNFDYIMYQLEAMMLQKYNNIEFEMSKSFFQIAKVLNTRFLLLHGDGIKGFGGFPWYGVERAVARLHQMLDFTNETFNMVALGHFHEPINTERFICNGNLKGSEEFSIGSFFPAVRPSQTLLLVDEKNGIVDIKKIYLDSADNRKDLGLPMGIDSVWAKSVL